MSAFPDATIAATHCTLTAQEADGLLLLLKKRLPQAHDMCLPALYCGLRFGEVAALDWKSDMTIKTKAILMVVTAAALWSTGGFFIKWINWTGISIAGCRSLFAAIFICCCLRRLPRIPGRGAAWACMLLYSLVVTAFALATKMTTAANAIVLQYLSPVYVALLAPVFLKEATSRRDWLFIFLAACGMALFFMDELSAGALTGNILGIFSGVFFAAFCMTLRCVPEGYATDTVVWGNLATFLISLPFIDFQNIPEASGWFGLLALGCFQLGLSYYLYTRASVHLTALELIIIPVLEPLLNPLLVALFLGEIPGRWSITGGVLVLSTVTGWAVIKARKNSRQRIVNRM